MNCKYEIHLIFHFVHSSAEFNNVSFFESCLLVKGLGSVALSGANNKNEVFQVFQVMGPLECLESVTEQIRCAVVDPGGVFVNNTRTAIF